MAPHPAPASSPTVGEGARDQNNIAVAKSDDFSMGPVKDGADLLVPCPEHTSGADVAPQPVEDKGGDAVAPAPAPAASPTVGEGAWDQNNIALGKSDDVSMVPVKDGADLPVPCSEPTSGPEVAPQPVEDKGGDAMAPTPARAASPTVGLGASDQNNMVVAELDDISVGAVKDGADLPVSCSVPNSGPDVAPQPVEDKGGDAMAPTPAPAASPTVGVGASDQNNMVVVESDDISMGPVKDGADLPVSCSVPNSGPEVAPQPVEDKGGDAIAPAPAPAASLSVGEGAREQNNMVVAESDDISMEPVKNGADLPVPCSVPTNGPEVAPQPVEDKGGDTTESSSSFGGTFSGFDDEADGGEPEVSSHPSAPTDGEHASMLPRRKKVTAEWRNSIRPIMWRCQWLELRMKDLQSQVSRYDRELALIEKEKKLQQAASKTNGSMPDAMPIGKDHRNITMKRRERKRHEDTADTSLYIKKHPILSYYNDKQGKGAETDGQLLDDDHISQGGLDTAALLDAEEYDTIFEQVTLNNLLSTIDGVQSRVHLLQDRLNKAHHVEDNLAFSDDSVHVSGPRKRKSTQKFCDTTYMKYENTKSQKYRNARPQKRKNLNILLQDDDGPAVAVKPGFPDSGTDCQIEEAKENSTGKSGEGNHSQDRAITNGLLLGVDNSLPNGHMGDLCEENTDDILKDNRTASEDCSRFEKNEHMPSETSSKGQDTSAPLEVKTSAPMKIDGISSLLNVDSTSATVVNQEPLLEKAPMLKPVKKRDWKPKERKSGWGSSSSSLNHGKGASATSVSEQKSKDAPTSVKESTESAPTASEDLEIMIPLAAWKKRKAGKKSASEEDHKAGNSASKKQKTGKSSSGTKKGTPENSPSAAKNQASSPTAKTQAVLVTLNSRRSQRVRKPKVY